MPKRKRPQEANTSATSGTKRPKAARPDNTSQESSDLEVSAKQAHVRSATFRKLDESELAAIPEPPPGLTKDSRKRWRKRQIVKIVRSTAALSSDTTASAPKSSPSSTICDGPASSENAVVKKGPNAIDRPLLRELTRTTLVRKPAKRWIEVANNDHADAIPQSGDAINRARLQEATCTTLPSRPDKHWTELAPTRQKTVDAPRDRRAAAHSPSPSVGLDNHAPTPVSPNRTSSSVLLENHTNQTRSTVSVYPKTIATVSTQASPADHSRGPLKLRSGIGSIKVNYGSHGPSAKPVTSLKASSVPSYSTKAGAQSAFKRFSDYMNHRNESGSDEDSDESESDSSGEDGEGGVSLQLVAPETDNAATGEVETVQDQTTYSSDDQALDQDSENDLEALHTASNPEHADISSESRKCVASTPPLTVEMDDAATGVVESFQDQTASSTEGQASNEESESPSESKPTTSNLTHIGGDQDNRQSSNDVTVEVRVADLEANTDPTVHDASEPVEHSRDDTEETPPAEDESIDAANIAVELDQDTDDDNEATYVAKSEEDDVDDAAEVEVMGDIDEILAKTSAETILNEQSSETVDASNPADPMCVQESTIGTTQPSQDLDDAVVAETSPVESSNREFDLLLFGETRALSMHWPANVGLKRSCSFLSLGHGGSLSGFGRSRNQSKSSQDSTESLTLSLRFGMSQEVASEDTDDLDRTIAAVSREVFESTRALPQSKQHDSPLRDGDDMVTDLRSDFDLSHLLQLDSTLKVPPPTADDPSTSPYVYVCDISRVEGGAVLPVRGRAQGTADNEQDENGHTEENEAIGREHSSSGLSELSQSPPPPPSNIADDNANDVIAVVSGSARKSIGPEQHGTVQTPAKRKRKMSGITSKHFSPQKAKKKNETPVSTLLQATGELPTSAASQRRRSARSPLAEKMSSPPARVSSSPSIYLTPDITTTYSRKRSLRKSTTKASAFFTPAESPSQPPNTDTTPLKPHTPSRRVAAGTSTCPVPPISSPHFGLIQEKLWREPIWLIIAVTFLNKTAGRHAAPIFWDLKATYPTPELLAQADEDELFERIKHLGLGNQRSKRLISIARVWSEEPPEKGRRHRTLHYPAKGDGKDIKKGSLVEEDANPISGALEIGHIPGCGPYAWDSWRIFCRDVLRGVAEDYNGLGSTNEEFEPEWQRVLPLDKELRACLRWMWLREGWIWDHESGEKRRATGEEMQRAESGMMEIQDEGERKFAVAAAAADEDGGVEGEGGDAEGEGSAAEEARVEDADAGPDGEDERATPSLPSARRRSSRKTPIVERELNVEVSEDEIAVSPRGKNLRNGKLVCSEM